jgi:hypothetical protein
MSRFRAPQPRPIAKQFSSFMFGPTVTGIPLTPTHSNVTQGVSETPDLPEPYCVKQNTRRSGRTDVIAAQHGDGRAVAIWDYNDAEKREKT